MKPIAVSTGRFWLPAVSQARIRQAVESEEPSAPHAPWRSLTSRLSRFSAGRFVATGRR